MNLAILFGFALQAILLITAIFGQKFSKVSSLNVNEISNSSPYCVLKDDTSTLYRDYEDTDGTIEPLWSSTTLEPIFPDYECWFSQKQDTWISLKHVPSFPILDYQWADLPVLVLGSPQRIYRTSNEDFQIPFSLKFTSEVAILICDNSSSYNELGKPLHLINCYWVGLGASGGGGSYIRKCVKNITYIYWPRNYVETVCHKLLTYNNNTSIVGNGQWQHFILSKQRNVITVRKHDQPKPFLQCKDNFSEVNRTVDIIGVSFSLEAAYIKIHRDPILKTTKNATTSEIVLTNIQANTGLCLSVTACKGCSFKFNGNDVEATGIKGFDNWQKIFLRVGPAQQNNFYTRISVQTIIDPQESIVKPYWYISKNVKKCDGPALHQPQKMSMEWDEGYGLIIHWQARSKILNRRYMEFLFSIDGEATPPYQTMNEAAEYVHKINIWPNQTAKLLSIGIAVKDSVGQSQFLVNRTPSPPKKPKFVGDSVMEVVHTWNTSFAIRIPAVTDVEGDQSYMYVIVTNTGNCVDRSFLHPTERKLLQNVGVPIENSWVAAEISLANSFAEHGLILEIGQSAIFNSKTDDSWVVTNRKLEPENTYNLTILLNNTFRNFVRYRVYTLNYVALASASTKLYLLCILLLILAITCAFCIFCIRKHGLVSRLRRCRLRGDGGAGTGGGSYETELEPYYSSPSDWDGTDRPTPILRCTLSNMRNLQNPDGNYLTLSNRNPRENTAFEVIPDTNISNYVKGAIENGELRNRYKNMRNLGNPDGDYLTPSNRNPRKSTSSEVIPDTNISNYAIENGELRNRYKAEDIKLIQFKEWCYKTLYPKTSITSSKQHEEMYGLEKSNDEKLLAYQGGVLVCDLFVVLYFFVYGIKIKQLGDVSWNVCSFRWNKTAFVRPPGQSFRVPFRIRVPI